MHAAQAHHAEEVLDVIFPSNDQPTKVMEPSKKSFHSPAFAVTPQGAAVLRRCTALPAMRCDHLDAISVGQISVQAVAVIGFVADQSCGQGVEEALSQDSFDELAFVRRSTLDTNGERKTVIIGDNDDFRPFAALGGPDRKAPFFAPEKEASIKASCSCSFPRACNSSANTRKMRSSLPSRTHRWKRRWQVW